MKTMAIEEARDLRLGELLEMLRGEDGIVLTEEDEGRYLLGALVDLDVEALALSRNAEFMAYLDACRARGEREGGTSLGDARRELLGEP